MDESQIDHTQMRYFALSRLQIDGESLDMGHGVRLSRTYVHLMGHPILAFAPAEPRKPHPGPWQEVMANRQTVSSDLFVELAVPYNAEAQNLHLAWANWIVMLIRISLDISVTLTLESPVSFGALKDSSERARLLEAVPSLFEGATLSLESADWIRHNWFESFGLSQNEDLQFALASIYHSHRATEAFGIISIWAALERLFSAHTAELKYRVCTNLAAFLEPAGPTRYLLFKHLSKLYDDRSNAAHGSPIKSPSAYMDSATVAAHAIQRIIEIKRLPKKEELEQELLGLSPLHSDGAGS